MPPKGKKTSPKDKKKNAMPLKLDGIGSIPTQMRAALQKNLARVTDLFQQIDDDNSGIVDGPEFVKAMAEFGFKGDEMTTAVFDELDVDKSGTIEYRELHSLLVRSVQNRPDLPPLDITKANKIALRVKRIKKVDSNLLGELDLNDVSTDLIPNVIRDALDAKKTRVVDLFRQFDDDDSGLLDEHEFAKAISELGMRGAPPEAVAAVFKSFDPDSSGTIEYRELHELLIRSFQSVPKLEPLDLKAANRIALRTKKVIHKNANKFGGLDLDEDSLDTLAGQIKFALNKSLGRVIDLFRQFDDDASGHIDYKEFAKAMSELGLDVDADAIRLLFNEWDPDKSGYIEYEELKQLLRKTEAVEALYKRESLEDAIARGNSRAVTAEVKHREGKSRGDLSARGRPGSAALSAVEENPRPGTAPATIGGGRSARWTPRGGQGSSIGSTVGLGGSTLGSMKRLPGARPASAMPTLAPAQQYWKTHALQVKAVYIKTKDGQIIQAFEIMGGRSALVHRGSAKLAVVTHPVIGKIPANQVPASWFQRKMATRPLHQSLIDAGYNVLAFEAHPLALGGHKRFDDATPAGTPRGDSMAKVISAAVSAETLVQKQVNKLEAVLDYIESHRSFRYCRVAFLGQGVGATAMMKLVADSEMAANATTPSLSLFRVRSIIASQPAPMEGLLDAVAPNCHVPMMLVHADDGLQETSEIAMSVHAALPAAAPAAPFGTGDKEVLTIPRGGVPLYGRAKRFDGASYWGLHPGPLLAFLRKHV